MTARTIPDWQERKDHLYRLMLSVFENIMEDRFILFPFILKSAAAAILEEHRRLQDAIHG